jgi:type III secretory pathway component EscR
MSDSPLTYGTIMVGVSILSMMFFLVTPFIKLSIVFGVLRTGFGSPGIPGAAALGALSLILSLHVVAPIAKEALAGLKLNPRIPVEKQISQIDLTPLADFLRRHTGEEELKFFKASAGSLLELIPAFVLSELRTGFEMALLLFIPFLVIDLVVTTVLTGMGMMMVNPVNIAFPLKLLLFVSCDGWLALSRSLIASYA